LFLLLLTPQLHAAKEDLSVMSRDPSAANMLRVYLTAIAKQQLSARSAEVAAIRSVSDFEQRRKSVRAKLDHMIGQFPQTKTPLNVRKVGTLDRDGYTVEKIIYESSPKFYVTANLYVPKTGKVRYPAILQSLGHSVTAKSRDFYQSLAIGLVKNDFVVLNYDPLGQGERRVFWDPDLGNSKIGDTVMEHEMVGMGRLLMGDSIARYMIWDGIRGIDLLEGLPNVDPQKLGVAGCSGGGTLTAYLAALDPRVKVAASACYITSWQEQLDGTGPQDAEQQFPALLAEGLDHSDLVEQFAPKPYLIASTTDDFFPVDGAHRAYDEAKRIYGLFGASDRIGWFTGPGGHGMRRPSREAIYSWMNHYLRDLPATPKNEPEFVVEFDEELNTTPTGQVSTSLGGETANTLKIAMGNHLAEARKPEGDLRAAVIKLTRFERSSGPVSIISHGVLGRPGYGIERLVFESSPGRKVPALLFLPNQTGTQKRPILFADSRGKAAEAVEGGDLEQLVKLGYPVLAIDPAGIGESISHWSGYSDYWFGESKIAWLGLMISRPLMGLRMEDIVRGIDVLSTRGLALEGVSGFTKGSVGVAMLHAAIVDDRIQSVTLEGSLASYELITTTPLQRQIHDLILPDVLHHYDLVDLALALGPNKVHLVNLKDPMWNALPMQSARKIYRGSPMVGERREFDPVIRAYPEFR
jgi:cephalosporin-C deacetylase-like acetyl esterase